MEPKQRFGPSFVPQGGAGVAQRWRKGGNTPFPPLKIPDQWSGVGTGSGVLHFSSRLHGPGPWTMT